MLGPRSSPLSHPCPGTGAVGVCGLVALHGCFFAPIGNVGGSDTDGTANGTHGGTLSNPTTDSPTGSATPQILCTDAPNTLQTGFLGVDYMTTVRVEGGQPPYSWDASGLPPGLKLEISDSDSTEAFISGTPTVIGDFPIEVNVSDAIGTPSTNDCGAISIFTPLALESAAFVAAFPEGCVSDPTVDIDDLLVLGILSGGDGTSPTCALHPGLGNGSSDFDDDKETPDSMPTGIAVDPTTCRLSGTVDPALRFGAYAWITTVEQSGVSVYLPYCASQSIEPAYVIRRTDGGEDRTLAPGLAFLAASADQLTYGDDLPDPQVTIEYGMSCAGSCFYAYMFSYSSLSVSASVTSSPSMKFPAMGFEGFTHAIRIAETDSMHLDDYRGRAFVIHVQWDYCMAPNDTACGNNSADPGEKSELIRENGGGGYHFSLIVLPE